MINDTKREIKRHEHQFAGKHHEIDYLEYEEKKSSHLIVVLSGFNGKEAQGTPARYNYMRTLQDIKINKLFIKDEVEPITLEFHQLGADRDDPWSYAPGQLELLDGVKAKAKAAASPKAKVVFRPGPVSRTKMTRTPLVYRGTWGAGVDFGDLVLRSSALGHMLRTSGALSGRQGTFRALVYTFSVSETPFRTIHRVYECAY